MSRHHVIRSINELAVGLHPDSAHSFQHFLTHGVAVVKGNKAVAAQIPHFKALCDAILHDYVGLAKHQGGLGIGKENGFRELVQKDVGRFDLNLDHLINDSHHKHNFKASLTPNESELKTLKNTLRERIAPTFTSLLGPDFIMNAFGAVTSSPGTEAQNWHVDSSHIFTHHEYHQHKILPCHFTTVFFPLYSFSESIGPTEIALGSQHHTHILNNRTVPDQYPEKAVVDHVLAADGVSRILVDAEPGDIVIMDGRTLHRGLTNNSKQIRSLVYLSFCRPWYREFPPSQSNSRSLFL